MKPKFTSSLLLFGIGGGIALVALALATGCMPGQLEGSYSVDAGARTDSGSGGGGDEFADASICLAEQIEAERVVLPVDIIWAVDNSPSMGYETSMVETNLNAFAAQIDSWGIDYRVIMIAERGSGDKVCVPPPLGGANCGDGPRFRHIPDWVGSHNALGRLGGSYSKYQDFLREDSMKHFVVVTDDEAEAGANDLWFESLIPTLANPGFPARPAAPQGFVFHSIVGWGDNPIVGCNTAADIGQSYLNLTTLTGGVKAKVCETDWSPIFEALQQAVVEGTQLPCALEIPDPPNGESFDVNKVNVLFTPAGGTATTIPRVDSLAACGDADGWYYDDAAAPTQIIVCPSTCETFTASEDGQVDLQFGCETVVL